MSEAKTLTPGDVESATPRKKAYRLADAAVSGLMLSIHPSGVKYWRLQYSMPRSGETKVHSLGIYPEVSLVEARTEAVELHKRIEAGDDPEARSGSRKSRHSSSRRPSSFLGRWISAFAAALTSSATSAFLIRTTWLGLVLTGFMVTAAWAYGTFLQQQTVAKDDALRAEFDQLSVQLASLEGRLSIVASQNNELLDKDEATMAEARKAVDNVGEMAGMMIDLEERMGKVEKQFPGMRKQLFGGIQKSEEVAGQLSGLQQRFASVEDKVNEVGYWNSRGAFR